MGQIQDEQAVRVGVHAADAHTLAPVGGSVGVVSAHVHRSVRSADEASALRGISVEELHEAMRRILALQSMSAIAWIFSLSLCLHLWLVLLTWKNWNLSKNDASFP